MSAEQGIPVTWLKEKKIEFVPGDVYETKCGDMTEPLTTEGAETLNRCDHYKGFIVSFTDRPNTGTQPVDDDVVVDVSWGKKRKQLPARGVTWELVQSIANENWKPNHAAMLAKFKSEQGAKQMNYLEQEIEKADYIYSYSTTGKDAISFYRKQESGIHLDYLCPDRKVWQSSMMTIEQVENDPSTVKLDYRGDEHKEEAHHIAIQIEKLGTASKVDLKCHDIDEDGKMTPVFTQAMADAGELPPVGSKVDLWLSNLTYCNSTITYLGDGVGCFRTDQGLEFTFAAVSVKFKPIDNRTEDQKLRDAVYQAIVTPHVSDMDLDNIVDDLVNSCSFNLTLKD